MAHRRTEGLILGPGGGDGDECKQMFLPLDAGGPEYQLVGKGPLQFMHLMPAGKMALGSSLCMYRAGVEPD